jgi:hypothetical protein
MSRTFADAEQVPLPPEWHLWLAENLLLGVQEETLVSTMAGSGFSEAAVRAGILALHTDPCYQASTRVAERLHKLESLADSRSFLESLAPESGGVERADDPGRVEFLDSFYSRNRPAVLTNVMNSWRALGCWSPEYLAAVVGDETVEVMTRRDSDPDYEIHSSRHKERMSFAEYVGLVVGGGETNDYYLVANNHFLSHPRAGPLFSDMHIFPQFLDGTRPCGSLWFGSAGTVTPLHHDLMNILLAQVSGRKRIVLISPDQTHLLYNEVGVYSAADWERPDLERFPLLGRVRAKTVDLEPGEVLFIPVGWWHHVRSLDISISVSFTNFIWPNHFDLRNPAAARPL